MDIRDRYISALITGNEWVINQEWGLTELATIMLNANHTKKEISSINTLNGLSVNGNNSSSQQYKIGVIQLQGVMITEDQSCGPTGIRTLRNELYKFYSDSNISGILIEANTGGGQASAAKMLNSAIIDRNKPVVVHAQMLASGGIWGTINVDEIIGDVGSTFGSVGAYTSIDKEMVKNYLNTIDDIYADQSSDKNKDIREYLLGNKEPLQQSVNKLADDFIKLVKPKLKGTNEEIAKVLKGGMFDSNFSLKTGLINRVGTRNLAINRVIQNIKYYKNDKL